MSARSSICGLGLRGPAILSDSRVRTGLTQLTQLRSHLPASLRPEAAESGQQQPMFLLGDFNALRRRDYSDEEWEALCDRRAKAQIDSPTAVTETLEAVSKRFHVMLQTLRGVVRKLPMTERWSGHRGRRHRRAGRGG